MMKVVATTVRYEEIPRVVELVITGVDGRDDDTHYCMSLLTWAQIEPCYAEKWECILEYRDRDATPQEYESVKEVMRELEQMQIEADLPNSDVSNLDLGSEQVEIDGYFDGLGGTDVSSS